MSAMKLVIFNSKKDDAVSKVEFGNYFKSLNINDQHVADEVFAEMVKNTFLNQNEMA